MSGGGIKGFIAVALLSIVGPGCGGLKSSTVRIDNQSGSSLTDIRVLFPENPVEVKDIGPKQVAAVKGSPSRDGVIVLEFVRNERQIRHELTYVAPPINVSCVVVVLTESIERNCNTK